MDAAEMSPDELRELFVDIAAGAGNHGDFVRTFAELFNRADPGNVALLLPLARLYAIKYRLTASEDPLNDPPEMQIKRILLNVEHECLRDLNAGERFNPQIAFETAMHAFRRQEPNRVDAFLLGAAVCVMALAWENLQSDLTVREARRGLRLEQVKKRTGGK